MDSPQPTQELQARITSLEERLLALEGAVNAFIVVYGVRRLPHPGEGSSDAETATPD